MNGRGSTSALGPARIGPDGTLANCPECGGRDLRCVSDGELTNFFCGACQCCWHLELGWVHRIDPTTCPGCAYQPLCRASRVSHRTRSAPAVTDDVLADRIRSTIGPLEQRLDVPRVHVMVEGGVALLHGDVGTADEADQIEQAVQAISGVPAVESYLHVGLLRSDTRPSEGRREHAVSEARKRLLAAAVQAGVAEQQAPVVVRAILSRFAERLPDGERQHLVGHLPADVRSMLGAPRRLGHPRRVRSLPDLVFLTLVSTDAVDPATAPEVVTSVLRELQALIPEESADIAAVLPDDLRSFWQAVAAK